jgi:hypothetical protein
LRLRPSSRAPRVSSSALPPLTRRLISTSRRQRCSLVWGPPARVSGRRRHDDAHSMRTPRRRSCSLVSEGGGQAPRALRGSPGDIRCDGSHTRLFVSRDDGKKRHAAARRRRRVHGRYLVVAEVVGMARLQLLGPWRARLCGNHVMHPPDQVQLHGGCHRVHTSTGVCLPHINAASTGSAACGAGDAAAAKSARGRRDATESVSGGVREAAQSCIASGR